VMRKL